MTLRLRCYASSFPNGVEAMASEYSLPIVLEKIYENQWPSDTPEAFPSFRCSPRMNKPFDSYGEYNEQNQR
jgi:hypothetical protein